MHDPITCKQTWSWCRERGTFLSASHVPGVDNLVADFLSRRSFLPSEWTLKRFNVRRICQLFPLPEIDLFASALIFQLPKYCLMVQDSQAWAIDVISFPCPGFVCMRFLLSVCSPMSFRKWLGREQIWWRPPIVG